MGLSKQHLGTFGWGFLFFAALALLVLVLLRVMQSGWTRSWVAAGGRARRPAAASGATAWPSGRPHPQPLNHVSQE